MQITTTGCVNGATPWLEIMESTAGTFEAMARNMRATIDQWRPLEVLVIAGFALLGLVQITQSGKRIFERRRLIALHNCRPPTTYPHKDPLGIDAIRDAIQAGHTKTYLERQYKQFSLYGTTFSSRFFTSQIINTIEPENIKAVLSTDFDYYVVGPRRRNAFEPLLGRSLFQLDGREWYHSRSLIQPCFDRARNTNLETFELHVQNLIKAIPMDGSTVDLGPLFFRFAADVATDCILGRSVGSLVKMSAMDEEFVNAIHNAQKGCENRWQWGGLANFFPQREFYCSVEIVHRYIERYVDEVMDYHRACSWEAGPQDSPKRSTNRDEATSKHHVFLHDLSKITGDRKVIRDELLMAFFAGSDTVAALLTSLFFMLAKRPDIWHHLRQEVEKIEGPPTLPELKAMSYHQWCIRECEHSPAAWLLLLLTLNSTTSSSCTAEQFSHGGSGLDPTNRWR